MSPVAAAVVPVFVAMAAGQGAGAGALSALNPYGIANPVAALVLLFTLGATGVYMVRMGKIRGSVFGGLAATALLAAFFGGWLFAAHALAETGAKAGRNGFEFLAERIRQGVPLWGSATAVSGGWLIACWMLEALLFIAAAFATCGVESDRPFCEQCGTWARGKRWEFTLRGAADSAIESVRTQPSILLLVALRPGPDQSRRLVCRVGACRCARMASLNATLFHDKGEKDELGSEVMADVPLTAKSLKQVLDWAETIKPEMARQRIEIKVEAVPHETFALDPRAPEGGHVPRWRAGKGQAAFGFDNDYTAALRDRLRAGDYLACKDALAAQKHIDDYTFVVDACADWDAPQRWLDDWSIEQPDSATLRLIRGSNLIIQAWNARGADWKPKNVGLFWSRLAEAETELLAAAEARPKDPVPWSGLIACARGLQKGTSEELRLFAEAQRRCPTHVHAYVQIVQALAPKWGGTTDALRRVAAEALASLPAGSNALVAVAEVHIELAADAHRLHGRYAANVYWALPAVGRELRSAAEKCFRRGAHVQTMESPRARSWFAYALWKSGQHDAALELLRDMPSDDHCGYFAPWILFWSDTVSRAKKECSRAGPRSSGA